MKRTLLIFALALVVSKPAFGADATVGIDVELGGKRTVLGSGFFFTPSGDVLTAYHVIYGARQIKIFHGDRVFREVIIERLLPEADLAHLRVLGAPANLPFLQLADNFANDRALRSVTVMGYPRGLSPSQQFSGQITQRGFLRSEQFREPQTGGRLFLREGLELLPLDVSAYSGLSGSPVITEFGVVGIFSGSLHEGRGLSWAIPTSYVRQMRSEGRRAEQITHWPELLMTQYWRSLRKIVRVEDGLRKAVDQYLLAVDQVRATQEDALAQIYLARAPLGIIRKAVIEAELEARDSRMPALAPIKGWWKLQWPHMQAAQTALLRWQFSHAAAFASIQRVVAEAEIAGNPTPSTPDRNKRYEEAANQVITRLSNALKGSNLGDLSGEIQRGMHGAVGVIGDAKPPQTPEEAARLLGAWRESLDATERLFMSLTVPANQLALTSILRFYTDIGRLIEHYLYDEEPS